MFKKIHVFRVKPGQELLNGIARYCHEREIFSGVVIGIIGSVENARLNFLKALPGKYDSVDYHGPLEIVCAQGSIAIKDDAPISTYTFNCQDRISAQAVTLPKQLYFLQPR